MKKQAPLTIAADHPAFAGHFPGMPIVPGVILLDHALHAIAVDSGKPVTAWQISSVKFLSPLLPGETASIEHETLANGSIRFDVLSGERQIVTGSLAVTTASAA
jgi:3-hydroxymyristoyl/3-hydroxydecanoyl-(acyl carrier protein) dehydratase